jgi:hypothetical protein
MKESEVQYVHFRVGEDLGLRLMEIAQEHLTEGNDPVKALRTITESLHGCPTDIAVQILFGNLVLPVDVETQQVICQDRIAGEHDRFPRLDAIYFLESRTRKIVETAGYIQEGFRNLQYEIKRKNYGKFNVDFKYEDIFKFIAGDDEVILEQLRDNQEIDQISSLFEATKRFIEETMKTQATMEWVMKMSDDFSESKTAGGNKNYELFLQLRGDVADTLVDVAYQMNQTVKMDFVLDAPEDNVQKYIDSAREIDEVLSKGIEPVDIMSNWSAGWLSPEGLYYALNGEIANMLHNQIADALQEAGIVPNDKDEFDTPINPDAWLEQHGWVKIHGNNINYAGCLNDKIGLKNVNMTPEQIKKIYEYCALCHGGKVKVGWRMEFMSAIMFKDVAESNIEALNKKYFEF